MLLIIFQDLVMPRRGKKRKAPEPTSEEQVDSINRKSSRVTKQPSKLREVQSPIQSIACEMEEIEDISD